MKPVHLAKKLRRERPRSSRRCSTGERRREPDAMELNHYAAEILVDERLREMRAVAARCRLITDRRRPRRRLRAQLAAVLIIIGERLARQHGSGFDERVRPKVGAAH